MSNIDGSAREMIQNISNSLEGTIAQINKMNESIKQLNQNFSEEIVKLEENVRLIVEVLKQFRINSSRSIQELVDDINDKINELYEKKSVEAILEEEKEAISKIKEAERSVGNNLYFAQLLTIIQSIREETNRIRRNI
ncbi:MAG: hypothetical protein ACOC44_13245 [Promethearchaeia archaeon]